METKTIEKARDRKARLTIYIDKSLHRWLWKQRIESGKSVSQIAEDLMNRRANRDGHEEIQPKIGA